jgi:hypothetical protein
MDSMEYIYPSISEEMEYLELEVKDEMSTVGAETSFTTQRKVFQFLVTDLENHNVALVEQMREYRKDTEKRLENVMIELLNLRRELDDVNRENVQLHEMLIFFGNQLNRRASTLRASNSSITSDDSSILLDNILDELNNSTANDINNCKLRVDNAIDVIRKSVSTNTSPDTSPQCTQTPSHSTSSKVTQTSSFPRYDQSTQTPVISDSLEESEDVFEDLAENIALKDLLIKQLERENQDQATYINLLLGTHSNTIDESEPSPNTRKVFVNRGLRLKGDVFPAELPTAIGIRRKINDQLEDYIKNRRYDFESKRAASSVNHQQQHAAWEQHSLQFGSKVLNKWGYTGGGLGKNGNGITSPIKAQSSTLSATSSDTWPANTTLLVGDSMLNGLQEERLRRYNAKVEARPGATIKDMYNVITPLLSKKPSMIIIHAGTNDSPYKPSDKIVHELLTLRRYVESNLPGGKVVLSCPIMRTDNKVANGVIRGVCSALSSHNNIILNDKLDAFCLGKKGLHLNKKGCGKLAANFISEMQCV